MNKVRIIKDYAARQVMIVIAFFSLFFLLLIGTVFFIKAYPIMEDKNLLHLITSGSWRPVKGEFGFLPFILSTVYVSAIAITIALPLSLLTAIYLSSYASKTIRRLFGPVVDLLSGIPPVIYGVWGILSILPLISDKIAPLFVEFSSGYTILAGGMVLAVMIIPLLISIMVEVFDSIPSEMTGASLSLGATKWQTVKKIILRKSFPGIIAAIVLAISRAFGETIAVMMVCGNMIRVPHSILDSGYPLPALIANNYGEMLSLPGYESALMLASFLLFIIIVLFNGVSRLTLSHIERRYRLQ